MHEKVIQAHNVNQQEIMSAFILRMSPVYIVIK